MIGERTREAVRRMYAEGLSAERIRHAAGISHNTVYRILHTSEEEFARIKAERDAKKVQREKGVCIVCGGDLPCMPCAEDAARTRMSRRQVEAYDEPDLMPDLTDAEMRRKNAIDKWKRDHNQAFMLDSDFREIE